MNNIWIVFPLFSFVFLNLYYSSKGWRVACLISAVFITSFVVIFNEITSIFSIANTSVVRGFWIFNAVVSLGLFLKSVKNRPLELPKFQFPGIFGCVCLFCIGIIFLLNALVAFFSPPNNLDSLSYHLPRIMHWAVNTSVHFYPTYIERQLFYNPGSEFCLFHIFLLTGNDLWFNFLQWISFISCVISVSLIAKFLGASLRGQILAALFAATIPMAILQSTSTQNDLFASSWILIFVALGLYLQISFSKSVFYATSAAMGLSVLAKGIFFVSLGFVIWHGFFLWKKTYKYVLISLCIILVLISGHFIRSWEWQNRKAILSQTQSSLMLSRHDPAIILTNAMYQAFSEFLSPWLPVNLTILKEINKITSMIQVNSKDAHVFGQELSFPISPNYIFDEDYAPNPLHVLFIFMIPIYLWYMKPKSLIWQYYGCVILGGLLFLFIIKWQPWITRFHLPLLILFAPLFGLVMERFKLRSILLSSLLIILAFLTITFHHTRPLIGPNRLNQWDRWFYYFVKTPEKITSYGQASKIIASSNCHDVGLIEGGSGMEYPLWALTNFQFKYRSVNMDGFLDHAPCLVVSMDQKEEKHLKVSGIKFSRIWAEIPIQIYSPNK